MCIFLGYADPELFGKPDKRIQIYKQTREAFCRLNDVSLQQQIISWVVAMRGIFIN